MTSGRMTSWRNLRAEFSGPAKSYETKVDQPDRRSPRCMTSIMGRPQSTLARIVLGVEHDNYKENLGHDQHHDI